MATVLSGFRHVRLAVKNQDKLVDLESEAAQDGGENPPRSTICEAVHIISGMDGLCQKLHEVHTHHHSYYSGRREV